MATASDRDQSRLFTPMSEDIESYRIKPLARVVYGTPFELSIVALIVVNAVLLAILTFDGALPALRDAFEVIDGIILTIFVIELLLRIASYGKKPWEFFKSGWNVFDFIVVASIPFLAGYALLLRLVRLLRVLRLFRFMPEFQMLSRSLAKSAKPLGSAFILISFFMFIYGMAGVYIFGAEDAEFWGDLGAAMVTLTVLLTLENFPEALEQGLDVTPWAWLFFVSFMVLVVFTILNVLIGIVLNAMDEVRAEVSRDEHPDDSISSLLKELEDLSSKGPLSEENYSRLLTLGKRVSARSE